MHGPPPPPWAPLAGAAAAYELGPLLGAGAQGAVHLGRHAPSGTLVALKLLPHRRALRDARAQAHLCGEVASALRMQADDSEAASSTALLDFVLEVRHEGEPCALLVLELHPRGELMEYLLPPSAPLGDALARHYARQLLSAVADMHSRSVVHRDLKPENLLLDAAYRLRLSDFGLARLVVDDGGPALFTTMCGTPLYQSPEVVAGQPYDGAKSDLWACGVVLFILVSGRPPFGVCAAKPLHHRDWWWRAAVMGCWHEFWEGHPGVRAAFSPEARSLVQGLLAAAPAARLGARAALAHPWLAAAPRGCAQQQRDAFACMDARRCVLAAEAACGLRPALPPLMTVPSLDPAQFATRATLARGGDSAAALASALAAELAARLKLGARAGSLATPPVAHGGAGGHAVSSSGPGPLIAGARPGSEDPAVLAPVPSDPAAPSTLAVEPTPQPPQPWWGQGAAAPSPAATPSPLQQLQLAADYTMLGQQQQSTAHAAEFSSSMLAPRAAPAAAPAPPRLLAAAAAHPLRAMSIELGGEGAAFAEQAAPSGRSTDAQRTADPPPSSAPSVRSRVPVRMLKHAAARPAAAQSARWSEAGGGGGGGGDTGERLPSAAPSPLEEQRAVPALAIIVDELGVPLPMPTAEPPLEWRGRGGRS